MVVLFLLLSPLFVGVLCLVLVFVMQYLASFLELQSPWWGRENWLLFFNCIPDVLWLLVFCGSSSHSCELVCIVWLWYFWSYHLFFVEICENYLEYNAKICRNSTSKALDKTAEITLSVFLHHPIYSDLAFLWNLPQSTVEITWVLVDVDLRYNFFPNLL